MSAVSVRQIAEGEPLVFEARVSDEKGETQHRVTLSRMDFERLRNGATPERLVEAAFRFLLDREPKESILGRFDVSVISHYFPDFERKLPEYLK